MASARPDVFPHHSGERVGAPGVDLPEDAGAPHGTRARDFNTQYPRPVNNVVVDYETALERRHSQLLATSGLNHHEGKAVLHRSKDLDACRTPGRRIRWTDSSPDPRR